MPKTSKEPQKSEKISQSCTSDTIRVVTNASQSANPWNAWLSRSSYDAAFDALKEYINTEIIKDMKVMQMADLLRKFKELLFDAGTESDYRSEKLKRRIVSHYGNQLSFWHPKNRSKSEMVFLEEVPKGQIAEAGVQSASTYVEEEAWSSDIISNDESEGKSLQHVAVIVQQALLQVNSAVSQPIRPEDIHENNVHIPNSACITCWPALFTENASFK